MQRKVWVGQILLVTKMVYPFDTESPMITSGIRLGTPAATTRRVFQKRI